MNLFTVTEVKALNLERKDEYTKAEHLQQKVNNIFMKEKQPRSNLSKEQLGMIKEIKQDDKN